MTMNSKISFCIPTYNNAKYLERCIESVLDQDYENKEIIIVNDCSEDATDKLLKKYSPSVTIITNPFNQGQANSTNQAIFNASGEYCSILHSDDYLLPNFCKTLPTLLDKNQDVGIAVGERMDTDENDNVQSIPPFYDNNYIIKGKKQAEVFMFTSFLPCQVLTRRSLLLEIGMADPRYEVNLDGLMWFKCALKMDVAYIQEKVCCYRRHSASTTGKLNQEPEHIAKIYSTLKEMHRIGKKNSLESSRYLESEKRIGEIALKYAPESLLSGNFATTRRYLDFALFFDPDISGNKQYLVIKSVLDSEITDVGKIRDIVHRELDGIVKRGSYPPPVGSTKIHDSSLEQ